MSSAQVYSENDINELKSNGHFFHDRIDFGGRGGRMVVGFTTTYAISAYHI